ncbi:MAG: dephospho-CoA kinase [Clostridiaceae bacterium]|nr:dephospho-CoA kinase [Clostridiaceae bacterium]
MMFVIGITGGIGCGKSTAADICRQAGLPVIDADELSRAVTAENGAAIPELIEQFGSAVVNSQGSLDRQAMAALVFKNHRALDQLSAIVHRHVLSQMKEQVDKLAQKKVRAVVLDVPIPVKHGFLDICDQVWVVWADDAKRLERLRGRGMDENEARRRMAMQMTREEYTGLADHVIENNQGLDELTGRIRELLNQELGQRGIRLS